MDIDPADLVGTWMLVEANAVDGDGNPLRSPYGPQPMGRLVLTAGGRMMAVLCDGRPAMPEGEARAFASYCGNYRIEDGCLVTTVDASAPPGRLGGQEVRRLTRRGTQLVLTPPRRKDGEQRELFWERCGPA